EDRELDFQQWQAVMKDSTISTKKNDGETWSLQMRLRDREGYYKWFLVRQAIYERDDQGKVLLGRGLALDIHESKLTEELLHLTEERLRFLLEASPVVIYTAHATNERQCTYISKNVQFLLGYSSGEFLSNYNFWLKNVHAEDRSRILGSFNYLLERKSYIQEYRFQHKKGHYLWLRDEQRLVCDSDGKIKEIIGSVVDISDRRSMELALQTSEKHLNTIVSKISDGIIILDQQGRVNFANPMASQMFNLRPSEIQDFTMSLPDNPEENWEMGIALPDGSSGLAEVKMSWVIWEGESRYLMSIRDITRRREDAEKIRQSTERELLLSTIAKRIRQSLDLEEILTTTVEEVRSLLNCDRVLIYRVYPQGTGRAIAESVGEEWQKVLEIMFPEEVFPLECYEPYYQGKIFALDDRRGTPESGIIRECLVDFLKSIEVQAKLVVPIVQTDCLWGLLIAHQCSEPRHWEDWEIQFLQQLSTQLSLAIQQSLLLQQLQLELTERQQMEKQLIAITQLQKGILDGANYSIISVNIDGIIQSFNKGAEKLLGYQAEDLIGLETTLIFHDPQEIAHHGQLLSQELARTINPDFEVFAAKPLLGMVDEREWTYIHKNGDRIPVMLSVTALFDGKGNCSGFLGVASDISERKAIESERQKLEFLVKKSAEFIAISDLDGNVIFLNEGGQKLVGLPNLQTALKTKVENYHPPEVFKFLY
ncbi:MAG: PAS domain S-box protein, partial [Microcystaceae cyanobacterium]